MTERNGNWFVRVLIVLFCFFLVSLIGYRFFVIPPLGDLSSGVLVVLALLVVLVLSESFDSFSVGKLLSLSREVEKKKTEVAEVKRENIELRSQIITIASNISQHQSNTNIFGFQDTLARTYGVVSAPADEVREEQLAKDQTSPQQMTDERPARKVDLRRLEDKAISKFIELENLQNFHIVRDIKLMAQIDVTDPISTWGPVFDGYINTLDSEIFVEVRPVGRNDSTRLRERLYLMLSKLYHYRAIKKSNVYLTLVLTTLPEDEVRLNSIKRILEEFKPAKINGLLRIHEINFTKTEEAQLFIE